MAHDTTSETPALVLLFLFVLLAMAGWYGFVVRPADAARSAIIDCMAERGDIHSREVYDSCVTDLRGEK